MTMAAVRSTLSVLAAIVFMFGAASARPVDDEAKVDITDTGFTPAKLEVKAGQTVVWKNTTQKEHTVTADEKKPGEAADDKPIFDSGPLKPGAVFQHTFDKAGTYGYHCSNHKDMKGSVVVK